jgi:RNA recognition motif-containing protein
LFDDSRGLLPAFVQGIGRLFLFAVEEKESESFSDCRKLQAMNIYVGNLAHRTTGDDLRQQFERFGTVSRVDVISDR